MRLLIVEDDDVMAQALQTALERHRYVVDTAIDGEEGWDYAQSFTYDLMLMDVSLPKLDGISLCQRLRDHHFRNPILLLTARNSSADKVAGLDAGADDYVVKPCTISELMARIRALLRRRSAVGSPILRWGDLSFDPSAYEAKWQEYLLPLSPKELGLLELLLRNPTQVFTKGAIIEHLWSFDDPPGEDTVRAHIKGLRRKLKRGGAEDVVETVYGVGYRLRNLVSASSDASPSDVSGNLPDRAPTPPQPIATVVDPTALKAAQTRAAVAQMWEQFRDPILARLTAIESAIAAVETQQLTEDLRADAEAQAHKLVGSLGMYGLTTGSDCARVLEQGLATTVTPAALPQLTTALASLKAALPETQSAAGPGLMERSRYSHPSPTPESDAFVPTVLVIDPDIRAADALVQEATQWNLSVQVVPSIEAAIARLEKMPPQAIILELTFPGQPQCGLSFLETLTQDHAQIPILVLTEQDQFQNRVAVARLGVKQFFAKPSRPAQVLKMVSQSLQQLNPPTAKIVAVDDDPILLQRLQVNLQQWGFALEAVEDPRQFWQVLQITQPDLLILDVEMPHINGIELCTVVRNAPQWSNLPIIFLSANRDRATLQQIYAAGADDFITKPVTEPELITRVVNRLERHQLLQTITTTDALTGITNRVASEQAFERFIHRAQPENTVFTVGVVVVNHLQRINEQYGYDVGDRILQRFGQLLKQSFTTNDIVARWCGSEFILGLYGLSATAAYSQVLGILHLLEQEVFLLENDVALNCTFRSAIATYPTQGQTLTALYQHAAATLKNVERDRTALCSD